MTTFIYQSKKNDAITYYENNLDFIPVATFKIINGNPIIKHFNCKKRNYYNLLNDNDKNLCEIILLPCKMYFDYDKKVDLTPAELKGWDWDKTTNYIDNMMKKYFGCRRTNISGSISCKKLSLHIVMSNTIINTREEMNVFKKFVEIVLKQDDEGFDDAVYTKDRLMKAVNQSKGDGRIQKERTEQNFLVSDIDKVKEHSINLYQDDTSTYFDISKLGLQKYIDNYTEIEEETKGEVYNPFNDIPQTKEMEFYKELCELINIEDLDKYSSWIKIVYSLRSISPECKDLCHYISQKSTKYDGNSSNIINNIFNNFEEKDLTEGTLHYYSKKGNSQEYYKILNSRYNKLEIHSHDGHSEELHKIIGSEYRFYKDGSIYRFNGIYWETMKNLDDVEKDIRKKYNPHFKELYRAEQDTDKKKELKAIVNNLGTKGYTLAIAQTFKQNYQIKVIEMETEPHLFAFENMLFNLETGEETEPSPHYNCIMNTGYDYEEPREEEMKEIERHFELIFPNPAVRECYKYLLASSLFGYKVEKFIVSNGCGGNGKSMLMSIHSKMLGEGDTGYSYTLQSSSLLQPLSMGANTEIAKINNKRLTICSEPSNGGQLDNSTIKELTGEDKINARQIYSTNTEVYVKHTLFMMCNNKPSLKETPTRGDARRFVDIPFDALFVSKDEMDDKLEEQKQGLNIDKTYHLGNNRYSHTNYKNSMRCPLFKMLLPYAKEYHQADYDIDGFIPDVIKRRGEEYIAEQDLIYEYVKEKCDRVSAIEYISVRDLFNNIKMNGRLREFGSGKDLMLKELNVKCSCSMGLARDYEKHKRGLPRHILCGWKWKDTFEEDVDELN